MRFKLQKKKETNSKLIFCYKKLMNLDAEKINKKIKKKKIWFMNNNKEDYLTKELIK